MLVKLRKGQPRIKTSNRPVEILGEAFAGPSPRIVPLNGLQNLCEDRKQPR